MAIVGACLCGGIRFELDKADGPFELCHCNRCRKVSGAANMSSIHVRSVDYRLLCGAELIRTYSAPILYQPPAYTVSFCGNCGSPVPLVESASEWVEVPAGLLDDDPLTRPDKHIFVEFVPPWDEIDDALPRFTVPDLIRHRTGREPADGFTVRSHYDGA
jgi:hypothetical protein